MKAIVCVDLNWGIGFKGQLLERIPEDMKMFKQKTIGKVVVMGKETFNSLPGKKPLKDRINIVLSRNLAFNNDQLIICRSINELLKEIDKYNTDDIFIIGGQEVYKQLLPYCTEIFVTKIENEYTADKHFINLDKLEEWSIEEISEKKYYNNIPYSFLRYRKK